MTEKTSARPGGCSAALSWRCLPTPWRHRNRSATVANRWQWCFVHHHFFRHFPDSAIRTWYRATRAQNRAQTTRAGLALVPRPCAQSPARHPRGCPALHLRARTVSQVLLDQRVFRLGKDGDQCGIVQLFQRCDYWQAATNSGIRPNLIRSSGSASRSVWPTATLSSLRRLGAKTDTALCANDCG